MSKKVISTEKAPGAIGPYSQAVQFGDMLITSGQLPIDVETGEMPEDVKEQTRVSLNNAKAILEAAGYTMSDVVKTLVFLDDMNDFTAMNEIYSTFFTEPYPARSAVEVAKVPKGAKVEIEVIAHKK